MAATLSSRVAVSVTAQLKDGATIGEVTHDIAFGMANAMTNGTGANQANQAYAARRTIPASSNESLDLSGGLENAFGVALTFAAIKAIVITAAAANTNDVVVGGAASNGFISWVGDATDTVKVKPGGMLVIAAPNAAGFDVDAGTADLLKIANSGAGTGVTYDIVIIGVAA